MTDLFHIEETPSPRVKWMRTHGITVRQLDQLDGDEIEWRAQCGTVMATGETENEAIAGLVKELGIRLWNEL